MTAAAVRTAPPQDEAAYRVYVRHTTLCAACRVGAACVTAIQLGRAWREARR